MAQSLILTLVADTSRERLTGLTQDLYRELLRGGVEVKPVEAAAGAGHRGDAVTVGQLVLALITSGAVSALLCCLRPIFDRERTLVVRVKRSDGSEVEVNAKNVGSPAIERALAATVPPT